MRFVTFTGHPRGSWREGRPGLWLRDANVILDLAAWMGRQGLRRPLDPPAHYADWFDLDGPWPGLARAASAAAADAGRLAEWRDAGLVLPFDRTPLLAPVPRPGKIVCIGLNYRDHAAEARMPVPEWPLLFAKYSSAVVGSGAGIELPVSSGRVDYEAELAVVIGRRTRRVVSAEALDAVFGYTNANDVSERDFQKRDGQWVRAKSCDTFAPLGPAIVTPDEVRDPNALPIRLRLNGQMLQDSNTDQFVFGIAQLIEYISATATLEPGDVILTGTPPGVGFARKPPVFLKPGDLVEVEIGDFGVLANRVAGAGQ